MAPYAFVTLISSDSYLPGALALVASLRDVHPTPATTPEVDFQTVCLVTPETVDVSSIKVLRKAFDIVVGVEIIEDGFKKGLELLGRPDLDTVLTKLHAFRLTQFSKIIFIDSDVLPIRPMSHLFTLEHEFSAVPDVGWPDIFNSGMMVFTPGEDKFQELADLLKKNGTWDGGDQGLLNEWRGSNWNRLSFTYNTTPTAAYTYAPAYERFGSQISAIHFIGPNKPWKTIQYRPPGTKTADSSGSGLQQAYDYASLVDRWYDVYDRHFRSDTIQPPTDAFKVERYDSVWNEQSSEAPVRTGVSGGNTYGLEELRKIAVDGLAQLSSILVRSGEGEYWSLPLEGRVDLMRPRRTSLENANNKLTVPSNRSQGSTFPSINNLPTPLPHELPPPPYRHALSLPPTPSHPEHDRYRQQQRFSGYPNYYDVHYQNSSPETYPSQLHDEVPTIRLLEGSPDPDHDGPETALQLHLNGQQHASHRSPHFPFNMSNPPHSRRRPSPPLLPWNPAIEPPPLTPVALSTFPPDTYFPNIWDQAPSKQHDATHQPGRNEPQLYQPASPDWNASAFFHPPPSGEIPERLLREGHYSNVTGSSYGQKSVPMPNLSKVTPIFPWEEQPRSKPRRVFPKSDAPPPGAFMSNERPPSPDFDHPSSPESNTPNLMMYSPPPTQIGQPGSLNFPNAWDTVPSIKNYASKLAHPHHGSNHQAGSPFQTEEWKKHEQEKFSPWLVKEEENSMDGDDEDDESDAGERPKQRSRSGSGANTPQGRGQGAKKYRGRATQTMIKETRSQSIQAGLSGGRGHTGRQRSLSTQGVTLDTENWSSSSPVYQRIALLGQIPRSDPPSEYETPPDGFVSPRTYSPPVGITPPRMHSPKPSHPGATTPRKNTTPPSRLTTVSSVGVHLRSPPSVPGLSRSVSDDTLLSSVGPSSPADTTISLPQRKTGRVWDPARGVDIFKRDSEEVLSRFLKMGSFDDSSSHVI